MTVQQLTQSMALSVFHMADPDRAVSGGYCGDLLSWVMSNAPAQGVWITIMSNMNVAAVAALTDVACVILAEDVGPDPALLLKARQQGINLLGTQSSAFDCAARLAPLL